MPHNAYQRQPECKQQPTVQHPLVPKKHWCALQPPTCSFDPAKPDYSEAVYLLVSVRGGKFTHAAAFGWNAGAKRFAEIGLDLGYWCSV